MNTALYYLFRSSNGTSVLALRGSGGPKMVGGGGGWNTVARPRRVSMTQWTGRDPYTMDVPILLDGYKDQNSIEEDVARLNQMQMSPGDLKAPPTVHIDGALPIKGATWVITSIDWGDSDIWFPTDSAGYRLRQDAVVHLLQFVAEDRLKVAQFRVASVSIYRTKAGDTLRSIAKKKYGDASKATLIKSANPGIRDPKKIKVGTALRIPTLDHPVAHPVHQPKNAHPKPSKAKK